MDGPAAVGGFGITGMDGPAPDGGLGIVGAVGGLSPGELPDTMAPETGTGFGGRLIIAVSRGLEAIGAPSRREGRTILTVSFFGSAILKDYGAELRGLSECETCKFFDACQ